MSYVDKTAIIDDGAQIGLNCKIWHFTHIMSSAKIGDNCSIGQNCFVGENVLIGSNVKIQNNVSVYEGVEIEDDVFLGPSVVFTNVKFPRSKKPVNKNYLKTKILYGASIGANSTIVCGITVAKNVLVGAGSVVTKDLLEEGGLYFGNPARFIRYL